MKLVTFLSLICVLPNQVFSIGSLRKSIVTFVDPLHTDSISRVRGPSACVGSCVFKSPLFLLGSTPKMVMGENDGKDNDESMTRRKFIHSNNSLAAGIFLSSLGITQSAFSASADEELVIPSVTLDEFEKILRDSARSVQIVEFSGAKSETVIARLLDGTTFAITGLVESSYDPRSPLKVAALCRGYGVRTKFVNLELAVTRLSKSAKRKSYANARVQAAAEKEREKRDRMKKDEEERLAELYKMEEEEARKQLEKEKLLQKEEVVQ